MIVVGEFSRYN